GLRAILAPQAAARVRAVAHAHRSAFAGALARGWAGQQFFRVREGVGLQERRCRSARGSGDDLVVAGRAFSAPAASDAIEPARGAGAAAARASRAGPSPAPSSVASVTPVIAPSIARPPDFERAGRGHVRRRPGRSSQLGARALDLFPGLGAAVEILREEILGA